MRKALSNEEVSYIFDFLLQLLKYACTGEPIAVSLATHLIKDFYEESYKYFDQILIGLEKDMNSKMITINFEIRARKYVEDFQAQTDGSDSAVSSKDTTDDIFDRLFEMSSKSIIKSQDMEDPLDH